MCFCLTKVCSLSTSSDFTFQSTSRWQIMTFISVHRLLTAITLFGTPSMAAPAAVFSPPPSHLASVPPSLAVSAPAPTNTVPFASDDPNFPAWTPDNSSVQPEAIRGSLGATVIGPQNIELDRQNPDLLAPPTSDHGSMLVASFIRFHDVCLAQVCRLFFSFDSFMIERGATVACSHSAGACQESPQYFRPVDCHLQQDQGRSRLLNPRIQIVAELLIGVLVALARIQLRFASTRYS
jgi:hypothetical protein